MSQSQGPPPPQQHQHHQQQQTNFFAGYDNLQHVFPRQNTTGGQGMADGAFQIGAVGPGSNDMMTVFNSNMLGPFGGGEMAMGIDPSPGVAAAAAAAAASEGRTGIIGNDEIMEESIARAENQFNTAANNVPGAGPLPPAAFAQMNLSSNNLLTEFTKRRNWPAKVVEELKDLLQILDANGRIKYVSPSITSLAGYTAQELQEEFMKDYIHPDDQGVFLTELNESIASGAPLRMFYRLKKKKEKGKEKDEYIIFEAVGHAHIAAARFAPNPNNQTPFCQAVFMMARIYPTKNASLLDSFLEHKIENERLKRRISELRREEELEDEIQRQWLQSQSQSQGGRSDITPSECTGQSSSAVQAGSNEQGTTSADENSALTKENLEGAEAGNKPDSLRDKMARYEGTSHTDTIELLTGLRYLEGERSRGITTGNRSPTLIRGDAGIAIPMERDSRPVDKKKKIKTEEYVCTDCGTLDSPEWRKGPSGPKTLCNACGLRWAKKEKKKPIPPNMAAFRTPMPGPPMG